MKYIARRDQRRRDALKAGSLVTELMGTYYSLPDSATRPPEELQAVVARARAHEASRGERERAAMKAAVLIYKKDVITVADRKEAGRLIRRANRPTRIVQ